MPYKASSIDTSNNLYQLTIKLSLNVSMVQQSLPGQSVDLLTAYSLSRDHS